MKLTIIRDEVAWRGALTRCDTHDFYHTWDFHIISKCNAEGSPVMFIVEENGGGILIPLLERVISGTNWMDLTSVYGYPSPLIYGMSGKSEKVLRLWDTALTFMKKQGYVSLFARGHPMLTPEILRDKYYEPIGKIVYVDCSKTEMEQVHGYRRNHRQNIKKLRDLGFQCVRGEGEDSLRKFREIYEITMAAVGASDYYIFPEKYYSDLLLAKDFNAEIWFAEWENKIVATGLLVCCGDFMQYHLSGTNPNYYKLAPSKLLIDDARSRATTRNKAYFVIGGGYKNRSDSLLNFKMGFSDRVGSFFVARIVLDEKRYQELSQGRKTDFFPAYRARGANGCVKMREIEINRSSEVMPGA